MIKVIDWHLTSVRLSDQCPVCFYWVPRPPPPNTCKTPGAVSTFAMIAFHLESAPCGGGVKRSLRRDFLEDTIVTHIYYAVYSTHSYFHMFYSALCDLTTLRMPYLELEPLLWHLLCDLLGAVDGPKVHPFLLAGQPRVKDVLHRRQLLDPALDALQEGLTGGYPSSESRWSD